MPLPSSGAITLQEVNTELSKSPTAQVALDDSDVRTLFAIPSGQISMSDGYGKSSSFSAAFFACSVGGGSTGYDRMPFANETRVAIGASLVQARNTFGTMHTPSKGYCGGGSIPSQPITLRPQSQIDGIIFSSGTQIDPGASLTGDARQSTRGAQNTTKGFFSGGVRPTPPPSPPSSDVRNTTTAFIFSNESTYNAGASFVQNRERVASVNTEDKAYWGGGNTRGSTAAPPAQLQIDGKNFSNDAQIDPGASLVQNRMWLTGASSVTRSRGYFFGGRSSPFGPNPYNILSNQIDGIDFTNESQIDPGATLSGARNVSANMVLSRSACYQSSSSGSGTAGTWTVDKFNFADESIQGNYLGWPNDANVRNSGDEQMNDSST
jgi:hypothetical protein